MKTGQENSGLSIAVPRRGPLGTTLTQANVTARATDSLDFAIRMLYSKDLSLDMVTDLIFPNHRKLIW